MPAPPCSFLGMVQNINQTSVQLIFCNRIYVITTFFTSLIPAAADIHSSLPDTLPGELSVHRSSVWEAGQLKDPSQLHIQLNLVQPLR